MTATKTSSDQNIVSISQRGPISNLHTFQNTFKTSTPYDDGLRDSEHILTPRDKGNKGHESKGTKEVIDMKETKQTKQMIEKKEIKEIREAKQSKDTKQTKEFLDFNDLRHAKESISNSKQNASMGNFFALLLALNTSVLLTKEFGMFMSQLLIRFSYTSLDVTLHLFSPSQGSILLSSGTLFYACSKFFSGYLIDNYTGGILNLRATFLIGSLCFMIFYLIYPQDNDPLRIFFSVVLWNLYRGVSCSSWASIGKVIENKNFFSWLGMASKLGTISGMIGLGFLMKHLELQIWFVTGIILGLWGLYLMWNSDLKDYDFRNARLTGNQGQKTISNVKDDNMDQPHENYVGNLTGVDAGNEKSHVVSQDTKHRKETIPSPQIDPSNTTGNSTIIDGISKENRINIQDTKPLLDKSFDSIVHPLDGKSTIEALQFFLSSIQVYKVAIFMMCTTVLTEMQSHFPLFFMQSLSMEPARAVIAGSAFSSGFVISILIVGIFYPSLRRASRSWYLLLHFFLALISLVIFGFFEISSLYIAAFIAFNLGFGLAPTYYVPYSGFCSQFGGKFSATLMGLIDTSSFGASAILHAYVDHAALLYGWPFVFKLLTLLSSGGIIALFSYVFSEDVLL